MLATKEIENPMDVPSQSINLLLIIGLDCSYATKSIKKPMSKCFNKELDVLCMNCMKLIPSTQISLHSLHCTQVNSEVKLMDYSPEIQVIDYKLQQLKAVLDKLLSDTYLLSHRKSNEYYLRIMREYAFDLVQITDYTKGDTAKCAEIILNITNLNKDFNGSPCIKIYVERLLVLAREKNMQLFSYYREITSDTPTIKTMGDLLQEKHLKITQLRKSKEIIRNSVETRCATNYLNIQPAREITSDSGWEE